MCTQISIQISFYVYVSNVVIMPQSHIFLIGTHINVYSYWYTYKCVLKLVFKLVFILMSPM